VTEHLETPNTTPRHDGAAQPEGTAQPEAGDLEAADVLAELEWLAARLDNTEELDPLPLTELAEQLATLHNRLQSALSELDRT
jgi:hypothetical protein